MCIALNVLRHAIITEPQPNSQLQYECIRRTIARCPYIVVVPYISETGRSALRILYQFNVEPCSDVKLVVRIHIQQCLYNTSNKSRALALHNYMPSPITMEASLSLSLSQPTLWQCSIRVWMFGTIPIIWQRRSFISPALGQIHCAHMHLLYILVHMLQ